MKNRSVNDGDDPAGRAQKAAPREFAGRDNKRVSVATDPAHSQNLDILWIRCRFSLLASPCGTRREALQ
jgi:hypothetical protein